MEQIMGILNGTLTAPQKSVEKLEFFYVKYKGNHCFSEKRRRKIREPLIRLASIVFTDAQLVEYNEQIKLATEFVFSHPNLCRFRNGSLKAYLGTLDRLSCFYDLNNNPNHDIIDRRIHIFEDLKIRSVRMIDFLKNRIKPFKVKGRSANINGRVSDLQRALDLSDDD